MTRLCRAALVILGGFLAVASSAMAQECTVEVEPNDTPAEATRLGPDAVAGVGGAATPFVCLAGVLAERDQDAFTWVVDEAAATRAWTLGIEGPRGALTQVDVFAVEFATGGESVAAFDSLLRFGTRDGSWSESDEFLVAPGRYVLGVSGTGTGDYVVHLRPQDLSPPSREHDARRTYSGEFDVYAVVGEGLEARFAIDEEGSGFAWNATLQVPLGVMADIAVTGPAGMVAEDSGSGAAPVRLKNLGLIPGEYAVTVAPNGPWPPGSAIRVALERAGRFADGVEAEPNDDVSTATRLEPGGTVAGVLEGRDVFRIEVDDSHAEAAWDLVLEASDVVELRLYDAEETLLQERRGVTGTSDSLHLGAGTYFLRLSAAREREYTLELRPGAPAADGFEREPNDTVDSATEVGPDLQVRGELAPQDSDVLLLRVTGEAQRFRIQAVGEGVAAVELLGAGGEVQARSTGERRVRLDDLTLLPGAHFVRVTGGEGAYAVRGLSLGPAPAPEPSADAPAPDRALVAAPPAAAEDAVDAADEDMEAPLPAPPPPPPGQLELEPNDRPERANRLQPGATHVGRLSSLDDRDFYRFHLDTDQHVRLELVPAEGDLAIPVVVDGRAYAAVPEASGTRVVAERRFLAGDHAVELRPPEAEGVPTGYYQLRLTLLGPLYDPADYEPNDSRDQAAPLPANLSWSGLVGETSGPDFYRLPVFEADTELRVDVSASGPVNVDVLADRSLRRTAAEDGGVLFMLPGGEPTHLRLSGRGSYDLAVAFGSPPDPASLVPREAGALGVELALDATELAAYWHEGQTVTGTVTVRNDGTQAATVGLEVAGSDARVRIEAPREVEVPPGQSVAAPVRVLVPADVVDQVPLLLQAAATSAQARAVAETSVALRCEASPVGVFSYWPLPTELLGRPDALWAGFGAEPIGEDIRNRDPALIDGRTAINTGGAVGADHSPTFRLASDGPVVLVGTTLDPRADAAPERQLRGFRIETSLDGESFETVLVGELESAGYEQAFLFEEPVTARYARLVFESSQGGGDGYVGEWRLIAADVRLFAGLDLSAPELGGHVVWSRPLLPSRGRDVLTPGGSVRRIDLEGYDAFAFVVGFQHGRAAQVGAIEWTDSPEARERFDRILVESSLDGPAGPWTPVGEWDLSSGLTMRADLGGPVWARYLRFTAPKPEDVRNVSAPADIAVFEAAVDGEYLSALAEWGNMSRRGPFEWSATGAAVAPPEAVDGGDDPESASRLTPGVRVSGSVAVGEDVDWYVFTVSEGENVVDLRLEGDPAIAYTYSLLDAAGRPVAFDRREDGTAVVLSAFVEAGEYYLGLEEPKRTVVFSWDTSGSVGPYRPITYSSLAAFARDVDGDREAVQVLAFNDPSPLWVLPYWSSDTERVQRAIAEFDPRRADSSNAINALLVATKALAGRDGTKAILFITDAETGGYELTEELWSALESVRPRVFTFEISSGGSDDAQDLMQDWAAVNSGRYDMTDGVGSFDAGFARASCLLRRPKRYAVEVTTGFRAPPGPGTLTVTMAEGAVGGAVEVIFDASGSMGQPLPSGEPRIEAAIRALETLVGDILPDGTPFALRAFGHVAPNSCETRLDVPLGPLDREAARAAVRAIEPKLLSQTAIADSLTLAAEDLDAAGGPRTIVLITDGAESCGGDPAAAASELRAAGDVAIAIVSLALDPESLAVFEGLAAEVGATYVDVTSYETLSQAITEALVPSFEVYDAAGALVATGRVGDTVELPMGTYSVRVLSSPVEVFDDVRVPGDGSVRVEAGSP